MAGLLPDLLAACSRRLSIRHASGHPGCHARAFPRAHWPQIYSTNPLERLNAEIKRRTNVVGIFPNDASITRLVGAMMLEQNDEWSLNRRYMQLEGFRLSVILSRLGCPQWHAE